MENRPPAKAGVLRKRTLDEYDKQYPDWKLNHDYINVNRETN